jgi:hypothetical protein
MKTKILIVMIMLVFMLSPTVVTAMPPDPIYLPLIIKDVSLSPTIFIFNEDEVVIHFYNASGYEGSNGLIWLQRVANPWYAEIELYWVGKVGILSVWRGTVPYVPVSGYYYLKNGLIFSNNPFPPGGNPAYIPESDYISIDHE